MVCSRDSGQSDFEELGRCPEGNEHFPDDWVSYAHLLAFERTKTNECTQKNWPLARSVATQNLSGVMRGLRPNNRASDDEDKNGEEEERNFTAEICNDGVETKTRKTLQKWARGGAHLPIDGSHGRAAFQSSMLGGWKAAVPSDTLCQPRPSIGRCAHGEGRISLSCNVEEVVGSRAEFIPKSVNLRQ